MHRMIYTKTNRYGISNNDLTSFLQQLKVNVVKLELSDGKIFLIDGYNFYLPNEFQAMQEGKLFPFPEYVSLFNKKQFKPSNMTQHREDLEAELRRPQLGTAIYD